MTQAFPLSWPEGWPRTAPHHRSYNWKLKAATLESARNHLYDQLRMLGAKSVTLSTNIPLRNDGEFYATLRPQDGEVGVAVYFQLRGKPMAMARDSFSSVAQNLRSLGLAIEHLRGLDRHGGAHMLERAFSGFSALPPPEGAANFSPNWREIFAPIPEGLEGEELLTIIEHRYRQKAKVAHSDAGGSDEKMLILNAAISTARKELKQ